MVVFVQGRVADAADEPRVRAVRVRERASQSVQGRLARRARWHTGRFYVALSVGGVKETLSPQFMIQVECLDGLDMLTELLLRILFVYINELIYSYSKNVYLYNDQL